MHTSDAAGAPARSAPSPRPGHRLRALCAPGGTGAPSPPPSPGCGGVRAPRGCPAHGPAPDGRSRLSPQGRARLGTKELETPAGLQLKCSWLGVCPHLPPRPEAAGEAHALSSGSSGRREGCGAGGRVSYGPFTVAGGQTRLGEAAASASRQITGGGRCGVWGVGLHSLRPPGSEIPPPSPSSPKHLLGKTGHSFI